MENFEDLIEDDSDRYIIVTSDDLTLEMIPFYSLPARQITELFSAKKKMDKFIKKLYAIIQLAMNHPEDFQEKVYNAPISYESLFEFFNSWVKTSELITQFKNGEIDGNGNPTAKAIVNAVDIYEFQMLEAMGKNKPVDAKLLIRFLSEHIKRIAKEHNRLALNDNKIKSVIIEIED